MQILKNINKFSLWKLSGSIHNEIFFLSRLASAGSQKQKILENYEKNLKGAKRANYFTSIFTGIFILSIASIPFLTIMRTSNVTITSNNYDAIIVMNTLSIGLFNLLTFVYLFVFGLMSLVTFMKGEIFEIYCPSPPDDERSKDGLYSLIA